MDHQVLVTGIGGPAGRSAVRYLKIKGFVVIGTDMREVDEPVDRFHRLPAAGDEHFTEQLLKIIKDDRPMLFIPTVTEELPIVSRLAEETRSLGCALFISSPEAVDISSDKLETVRFLAGFGIRVPKSFEGDADRESVLSELDIPLLAKPLKSRGGRGVRVFKSEEEFFAEERSDIVFQEYISGEEFDSNLFIDGDGDVRAVVSLKKTALKDGEVGNAVSVERVDRSDVTGFAVKVAKALNLKGPVDIDIRLSDSGEPVLLEVNARLGGNVLSAPEVLDSLIYEWSKECDIKT